MEQEERSWNSETNQLLKEYQTELKLPLNKLLNSLAKRTNFMFLLILFSKYLINIFKYFAFNKSIQVIFEYQKTKNNMAR